MMSSTHVLWLLAVCVTCHCASVQIYPDVESLVLAAGGQLTLSCRSAEEVTWIHKDFSTIEDVDSPLSDQYEDGPDHVSNLTIRHLSYKHVGPYKCQSTTHNSSIYIYVIDKAHLLADEEIGVIFAAANSDIVIPCKPTQPRINVTLTSPDREKLTPPTVPYDPQVGFTLRNITIDDAGVYQCKVATSPEYPSSPTTEKHLTFELDVVDDIDLPTPEVTPVEDIMVGETLDISCSVEFPLDAKYQSLSWNWPAKKREKKDPRVKETPTEVNLDEYTTKVSTQLVIRNVTYQDTGEYSCTLRGALQGTQTQTTQNIQVLGINESYLELTAESKIELLRPEGFQEVKFIAEWTGSPEPKLTWFSPHGKEIGRGESEGRKYKVEVDKSRIKLLVRRLEPDDAGKYLLKAHNEGHEKALNFSLLVESGPQISLVQMGTYYMAGTTYGLQCTARGYPLPEVTWLFQKCEHYPKCDIDFAEVRRDQYMEFTLAQDVINEIKSKYNWTAETTGILMCRACNNVAFLNKYLCENATTELLVTDLKEGFSMSGPEEVFEGDDVSLSCGVNKYHFAPNVTISYETPGGAASEVVTNLKEGISVTKAASRYSNKVEFKLSQAHVNHSGTYRCEATRIDHSGQPVELDVKTYQMKVQVLAAPKFMDGNTVNGSTLRPITGNRVELKCFAQGTPKPKIIWYKDEHPIQLSDNDTRLQLLQDDQILNIQYGALTDEGQYKCVAYSRAGVVSASVAVAFRDKAVTIQEHRDFFLLLALFAILVILCAIFIYKIRSTSRQYKRKLESLGLKNFEKGQTDALNPEFDVSQQAELLPYDKKWEFPRAKLKLGHQLGSGAFGVVMRAEADGIVEHGETTTVAVKMVKKANVDLKYLKALSSELKIMAHLGKHLNIVNLLGACTDNLDKRELLVIVEYCKYGNLHNLLLKHRDVFINQVDSLGDLDPTITTLKPRYVNVPSRVHISNSSSTATGARTYVSTRTTYTGLSDSSEPGGLIGPDGYLVPTVEKEPAWRSSYAGDRNVLESICTQDLICWAFQVARGMEYLASRKVMHGDLAARNILLADDNIVKICDFGLAKAMFTDANYLKTGDEPLPIKWMAIESIRDKIFSTQSDVWAYAVTLWEMFSLSRTPYPGIEGVENLYLKLAEGHRMEKPEYCTDEMYLVMLDCWQAKPVMRPNFTELVERVGAMVDDNVRKHYLNLNEVYLRLNDEALGQGQDYLAMLSSPDIQNQMSAPVETEEGDDGYLRPNDLRDDASMELKPMLPQIAESKASSFSNPSYLELTNNTHHLPETSYVVPRSRMSSVDDYDTMIASKQEATRALKLNWLFPPDLKTHTTFV